MRVHRRLLRCSAPLWALLTSSLLAKAEPTTAVHLNISECPAIEQEDVARLVALEIAPRLRIAETGEQAPLRAAVSCLDARARIEVTTDEPGLPLELDIDFDRVPKASRTRLLALAVAELIATSELERTPRTPLPDTPNRLRESPGVDKKWSWWLAPGVSLLGTPKTLLYGAELGSWWDLGPLVLLGDFQSRFGRNHPSEAEVDIRTLSTLVALSPPLHAGRLSAVVGPGFRAGWARLTGHSSRDDLDGSRLSGPWLGPAVTGKVTWRWGSWAALHAGAEVGYVIRPVRGYDEQAQPLLAIDGLWASTSVGFAGVH